MELNKLYLKVDNNFIIQGYFKKFSDTPYSAIGCEFNEKTDFKNATVADNVDIDKIYVGYSQYVNGIFIENKPVEE